MPHPSPHNTDSTLRIAVIAHPLRAGGGVSVGRNIISALGRVGREHQYWVSVPSGLGYEDVVAELPHHQMSVFPAWSGLWQRRRYELGPLRESLREFQPQLILALANIGIEGFDCPQAILCHNSYLWYPAKHYGPQPPIEMLVLRAKLLVQRYLLRRSLLKPQNILLHQTRSAGERISNTFRFNGPRVLCPNAVSKFSLSSESSSIVPEALQAYPKHFKLLYLTRYYPHKNLEAILRIFQMYRDELSDVTALITIKEDQHSGARRLLESIKKLGLEQQIVNVGPLPQEELGSWYSHCDALLMPTLIESFSGTYLEAMHFGLPILTSDLDFAHEVCGDAAFYFNPWNPASIKDAIIKAKTDPSLGQDLVARGRQRLAEGFDTSWEEVMARTLDQITDIIAQ